tara:strand:+ start:1752 stop:2771 length:1020 start_codon:yes stop_codon:yes gene_type:complete
MIPHSQPFIDPTDASAIESRLQTGMIAAGPLCDEFAAELAIYTGHAGAILTSSGTAALELCLKTLALSDAAEVILPTCVCDSVLRTVTAVGASPVFCDVGQDWNITATEVARCVTPRTGAIIVVHTFGIAADVAQLQEFGVPVIEDCCQSLGLRLPNGEHVGHQGYASFFSFHATKSLTTGEGGAVATSDPQLLSNLKRLRDADVHAPLSDLQAALGLSQLARYPAMLERCRQIAATYLAALPDHALTGVRAATDRSMWFRFLLTLTDEFDAAQRQFAAAGVAVRRGVDALLHRDCQLSDSQFPNAVRCYRTTSSIPLYPSLSDSDADRTCAAAAFLRP